MRVEKGIILWISFYGSAEVEEVFTWWVRVTKPLTVFTSFPFTTWQLQYLTKGSGLEWL